MPNSKKMTMIVARYDENLDWLKEVPWNYIVLNKGRKLPAWIKNQVKLQNIGREAHSYLTYIINHYGNLPYYAIFVQGNPFDHSTRLIKKINDFHGRNNFLPLSDRILYSDGNGYPNHSGLRITESASKFFLDDIENFEFPAGAQFIASKRAILFHSKMTYRKLRDFLIKAELPKGLPSTTGKRGPDARNLFSVWTVERLWKTLFDNKHKTIYD